MHWYLWKVKCYSKQTITAKKMKWTYQKLKFIVDACNTLKINWCPIFHKRIFFISSKPYPTLKLPSNLYDCENREFIVDACNTMKFNWCPFFYKRIFFISSKPYPTLKLPPKNSLPTYMIVKIESFTITIFSHLLWCDEL